MENILKAAVDRGASDLHIKAGDVFRARIDGRLVPLTRQALTPEQTRQIALHLITNEQDRARIDQLRDYDCSWGAPGVGRFRVNILRQRSSFMIVMRVIPFEVPTLERLGLPPVLEQVAEMERGLVLVTGAGKSSTMAAIVHHINAHSNRHVVTLENPIEFLHRDLQGSVTQREIGTDTDDVRTGLGAALRQDPDVVMLGEMRDAETIDTALQAVETGHLVISALHTADAYSTLERLISFFPPDQQQMIQARLAQSLAAVVSQRLLPRADGHGRVVAAEVLLVMPEFRRALADGPLPQEIRAYIEQAGEEQGMQTLNQHLAALVSAGTITLDVALAATPDPAWLRHMLDEAPSGTPAGARARQVLRLHGAPAAAAPASPALEGLPLNVGLDLPEG